MTKGEGNAILLLLLCSIAIAWWPYRPRENKPQDFTRFLAVADSLKSSSPQAFNVQRKLPAPFNFNPNKVSLEQLLQLGFKPYLAKRIIRFREKFKPYTCKQDLLQVYGMDTALFLNIETHIQLPGCEPSVKDKKTAIKSPVNLVLIELNSADSVALESLPCIGSKLARRIWVFREKLGGFYSKSQLKEVYGLDSNCLPAIYSKVDLNTALLRKIKINLVEQNSLASHPYFGKFLAASVIAYRNQHGPFKSADDMYKLRSLDVQKLNKILPYLDFTE